MTEQACIDFDAARAARDAGMAQALGKAERLDPAFADIAMVFLTSYAKTHREFAAYEALTAMRDAGYTMPDNERAFGQIFRRLARDGVICNSRMTKPHPARHCSPAVVWRSLIGAEAA